MTCALVFEADQFRSGPRSHYVFASSDRAQLRAANTLLHSFVWPRGTKQQQIVVPDTPVMANFATRKKYGTSQFLASVVGPKHVAIDVGRLNNVDAEKFEESKRKLTSRLAQSAGVGGRGRGVSLAAPMKVEEGETVLGRFLASFATAAAANRTQDPRIQAMVDRRMKAFGLTGFTGVRGLLSSVDGRCRERIEIHSDKVESPSWIRAVRPDPNSSLGVVAATAIPADAIGAIHVGYSPRELAAWFELLRALDPEFAPWRAALAPIAKADDAGLATEDSVTLAILRPVGTLLPEPVLLLRRERQDGEVMAITRSIAKAIFGPKAADLRYRERGGETPHAWVRFPSDGNEPSLNLLAGGGYLTTMRVGPYLALGFNPRTLRKMGKDVVAGKTLAQRAGFTERFPLDAKRRLEAWFDWGSVASLSRGFETPLQLGMLFFSSASEARLVVAGVQIEDAEEVEPPTPLPEIDPADEPPRKSIKMPNLPRLFRMLGEESFHSEPTPFGFVVHHDGSLVLSPTSILAVTHFAALLDGLQPFFGED